MNAFHDHGFAGGVTLTLLLITSLLGETGEGSPGDVNAGELPDNTGVDEKGQGVGATIVYVQGSWGV